MGATGATETVHHRDRACSTDGQETLDRTVAVPSSDQSLKTARFVDEQRPSLVLNKVG